MNGRIASAFQTASQSFLSNRNVSVLVEDNRWRCISNLTTEGIDVTDETKLRVEDCLALNCTLN